MYSACTCTCMHSVPAMNKEKWSSTKKWKAMTYSTKWFPLTRGLAEAPCALTHRTTYSTLLGTVWQGKEHHGNQCHGNQTREENSSKSGTETCRWLATPTTSDIHTHIHIYMAVSMATDNSSSHPNSLTLWPQRQSSEGNIYNQECRNRSYTWSENGLHVPSPQDTNIVTLILTNIPSNLENVDPIRGQA